MVVCLRRFYILAKSSIFHAFLQNEDIFFNFLLKNWLKRRNMVVCSKKLQVLTKSTIFHAFSQNEALSAFFCWKVDPNAETWWFARKGFKLWPYRGVFMLFRKMRHFLQLFAEKLTQTSKHGGLLQKVPHFGQIDDFSCFLAKSCTFCNILFKSWPKRRNMVVCSKKLHIFAKGTIFHAYSRNGAVFGTFCWKVHPKAETWWFSRKSCKFCPNRWFFILFCERRPFLQPFAENSTQTPKHGGLLENVSSFGQIDDFSCFFENAFCSRT